MAYLISHIAICLIFAQLLGLLLGWLLWGYAARQRGKEVQTLRERLADLNFMSARVTAAEPRLALQDVPDGLSSTLQNTFGLSELPQRPAVRRVFFEETPLEETPEEPAARQALAAAAASVPAAIVPPVAPDLEAEVRESKIQHLQQQVRELEGYRDRLPLLQADLSDAIAGRRSAETRFQEAKNDFEVRSSGLLAQIRDFESAAAEWDQVRAEWERDRVTQERELSAVKATLRDLQNSQRPQAVNAPAAAPTAELAELRERLQRVVREREALADELSFWKHGDTETATDPGRLKELEEAVRSRDSQLAEQAARLESLLWRVAELEPFAAEAPQKEEALRRQEAEIAGHLAVHSENANRLQALESQLEQLQLSTVPAAELNRLAAEHQAGMQSLAAEHQQRVSDLEQALSMKEVEIGEHVSARYDQINLLNSLQARISELEAATEGMKALEQRLTEREREHEAAVQNLLQAHQQHVDELHRAHAAALESAGEQVKATQQSVAERDIEIRALLAVHADTQREMESVRNELQAQRSQSEARLAEVGAWKTRADEAEAALSKLTAELQSQLELNSDKDGQLTFLHERLASVSSRLTAHQQRLLQLEPLAARTPEVEQKLKDLESRHHTELTRLKVNSAQRIRRFRQSINTFKT
jgi:chromosome segregation ATPase